MSTFSKMKTLQFNFNDETIEWQLYLSSCFSFVRCNHYLFINRFGHANIITRKFELMFEDIHQCDEDYLFFRRLKKSAQTYTNSCEKSKLTSNPT